MWMRKLTFNPVFKKELSEIEIAGLQYIIDKAKMDINNNIFGKRGEPVSLAYTSSSGYAMHNVMDTMRYIGEYDDLEINHLAITEGDMAIMVCVDKNERYHYYEIEPHDYY